MVSSRFCFRMGTAIFNDAWQTRGFNYAAGTVPVQDAKMAFACSHVEEVKRVAGVCARGFGRD